MATVLINKGTNLAESLPDELAQEAALPGGSHDVPLVDPEGNLANADFEQARKLVSQGYSQPSPEQLDALLKHAKYSSTTEQAKTALEGAAEAATFGLSPLVERAYGVPKEDITGRRETNPGVHALGQVGGLAGTALIPGVGQANVARAAGVGAAAALRLGEATIAQKIGSAAVRSAVETAMLQGTDEVAKMTAGDPNQSVQTAIADIGLGAILGAAGGAAFGSIHPLWKSANDSKLAAMLNAVKNKAEGIEPAIVGESADLIAQRAGLQLTPEIKAAVSRHPESAQLFQDLMERSGTAAGRKTQESFRLFQEDTKKAILSALGKSEADLAKAGSTSEFELGQHAQKAVRDEIKAITDPISEKFEAWKTQFKDKPLDDVFKGSLQAQLGQLLEKEGLTAFPDTEQAKLVQKFISGAYRLKTVEDLAKAQSIIGQETQRPELWNIGKKLKGIFRTLEDDVTVGLLGEGAPEKIAEHQMARAGYKDAMDLIDSLNDRLHVGSYAGPGSFISKLGEMKPEDILRRLSSKADAGLLGLLESRLPKTAELIKNNHLLDLMEAGYKKGEVNAAGLFRKANDWSPELKKFALPPQAEEKLGAIKSLLDAVPVSKNPSHTAGTFDAMMSKAPAGAMALISLLMGHNPATGFILGHLGRVVTSEIPDAVKLATLRFLGSGNPISSEAFKVAVDLIGATIKGERMLNSAVGKVFKAGQTVLPTTLIPSHKSTERLDKKLKELQEKPDSMMDTGGQTPHYLPGHGVAMGSTASRAVTYLNSIRPTPEKKGMLDTTPEPSQAEKVAYQRALQIAEHPLVVLNHVKQGTITPKDIVTMKTLYPDLYNRMSQKIMNHIVEMSAKGQAIPYQTRLSLSMFLGSPLDSTMLPTSIQATQPAANQEQSNQQAGPAPQKARGSMTAIGKVNKLAMTPGQTREFARVNNKS